MSRNISTPPSSGDAWSMVNELLKKEKNMQLKRTLWGYDPRWIRVEAIDDANPVDTLFTWFEPADSLTGMTDSPLKPRPAK